jgi:hypothetical protein
MKRRVTKLMENVLGARSLNKAIEVQTDLGNQLGRLIRASRFSAR